MIKLFHTLLGKGENDDFILAQKSKQAHDIKDEIQHDLIGMMNEINKVNTESRKQLKKLTRRLGMVSQDIAIATGAKNRGL